MTRIDNCNVHALRGFSPVYLQARHAADMKKRAAQAADRKAAAAAAAASKAATQQAALAEQARLRSQVQVRQLVSKHGNANSAACSTVCNPVHSPGEPCPSPVTLSGHHG